MLDTAWSIVFLLLLILAGLIVLLVIIIVVIGIVGVLRGNKSAGRINIFKGKGNSK